MIAKVINIIAFIYLLCLKDSINSYTSGGLECYDNNQYTPYKCAKAFCSSTQSVADAKTDCVTQLGVGATLLEIYSDNDETLAVDAINAAGCQLLGVYVNFWFGARGNGVDNYVYPTTQCVINETVPNNWNTGSPHGSPNQYDTGYCAFIIYATYFGLTSWRNDACNNSLNYICQKLYATEPECPVVPVVTTTTPPTPPTPPPFTCLYDGNTIGDQFISELNLSPNITIKNTRLVNFTALCNNHFENVLIENCTFINTLLNGSTFIDVTVNGSTFSDASIVNRYVVNLTDTNNSYLSFRCSDSTEYNIVIRNSIFTSSSFTALNIFSSSFISFRATNTFVIGSTFTNATIVNRNAVNLTDINNTYINFYCGDSTEINVFIRDSRLISSSFVRLRIESSNFNNFQTRNTSITVARLICTNITDTNLFHDIARDFNLTKVRTNNFIAVYVIFDHFCLSYVWIRNVYISHVTLGIWFCNFVRTLGGLLFLLTQTIFDLILSIARLLG